MQIPNEEYTEILVNYAIADQLPDCGMVNENAVLYFSRNGVMADVSKMYEGEALQPMACITFKDNGTPVGYSSCNEILILYYSKDMFDAAGVPYPSATKETAKAVLADYAMNSAKPACRYFTPNTQITTNEILFTALQDVWSGEKTAREAIDAAYADLCEAIVVD